jgi:glutamyl-Q tRNA(Asp) synthetase
MAGRFAPSPTGPLHAGSLLAAVGSYLDARSAGVRWIVRIEDLDTARVIPGCADEMLRTLEAYGFEWDGDVIHQSARREAYREALDSLARVHRTFECSCSRKDLAGGPGGADGDDGAAYPGTCRNGPAKAGATARRFRVSDGASRFDDLFLGSQTFDQRSLGDFVVERRDGVASYQLAVVVDDAWQGVTRVIRGADLLASTPWQMELQDALELPRPIYGHLPLLVEPDGSKLSKSRRSIAIPPGTLRSNHPSEFLAGSRALTSTLTYLSQATPPELARSPIKEVWAWALANWRPQALVGRTRVVSAVSDSEAEIVSANCGTL